MSKGNLLSARVNLAFVLHVSLEDIAVIKKFLEGLPNVQVVYQRADAQKLYIIPENEMPERGKKDE